MKLLALLLCLLTSPGWCAIASNTTGLYDLEGNLTDGSGLGNNGTAISGMFYTATNPWHGSQSGGGGGYFSIPNTVVGSSGCVEFSFIAMNTANTKVMFSIATAGATRALEVYHSATNMYAYSNSVGVNNILVGGLSSATKGYVKTTWDGTTWKVYYGAWTVAGTVTLTEVGSFSSPATSSPIGIGVCGSTAIGVPFDGYIDWVRVRNIYDPTTTATVDPSSSVVVPPLSPYMNRSTGNWATPKLYLYWLDKLFVRPLMALSSDCQSESEYNSAKIWEAYVKAITPTQTPNPLWTRTATATPTPVLTPTKTPSGL